jgi:hypothetical protein
VAKGVAFASMKREKGGFYNRFLLNHRGWLEERKRGSPSRVERGGRGSCQTEKNVVATRRVRTGAAPKEREEEKGEERGVSPDKNDAMGSKEAKEGVKGGEGEKPESPKEENEKESLYARGDQEENEGMDTGEG